VNNNNFSNKKPPIAATKNANKKKPPAEKKIRELEENPYQSPFFHKSVNLNKSGSQGLLYNSALSADKNNQSAHI